MSAVKEIRTQFSITQEDMAAYLRISRSQLNMTEIGRRTLSSDAMIKLGLLVIAMQNKSAPVVSQRVDTENTRQEALVNKMIKDRVRKCNYQLRVMKPRLDKLAQLEAQAKETLRMVARLRTQLPAGKDEVRDKLWLEIQEDNALKKIRQSRKSEQAMLQLNIKVLEFEMKELLKLE